MEMVLTREMISGGSNCVPRIPDYMNAQVVVLVVMRFLLVEVKESSELNHETLYKSVKMRGIYLLSRLVTINISTVGFEESLILG
jgi:hypothetical protein